MSYIIYKTTNILNGKYYIGVTNGNDPNYLGSGRALKSAIKEHGRKNFVRETLEIFSSEKEAYLRESQLVNETVVADRNSYNIGKGGKGGPGQSKTKEHIESLRKAIIKHYESNPGSGGRKKITDPTLMFELVEKYGLHNAAEKLNVPYSIFRYRYYRAKKVCPPGPTG